MNLTIGICDDDTNIHLQLEKYFTQYSVATEHDLSSFTIIRVRSFSVTIL